MKKNIFPSTKPLVALLHEHGYLFFLISAGWDCLVEKTSEEISADGFRAMKIRRENGKFLPVLENELFSEKGKEQEIKKIISELKIAKTMGFGDSIQDAAIFKSVKKPVALNPSEELLVKAKKENWYIADSKNVLEIMQKCFAKETAKA
jgi:phosphoserine phosphatase